MAEVKVALPPPGTPFVDLRTGLITAPWYQYLQADFNRAGGAVTDKVEEAFVAGTADVTASDLALSDGDKLLGRATAGAGAGEEIPCTAAGRALLADADASTQRGTLGLGTLATQGSDAVAITGGTIDAVAITGGTLDGAAIDGVTPEAVTATTIAAATINASSFFEVAGTQVVGPRFTGWTAMTGAGDEASVFDVSTVTLGQLAQRMRSIQFALTNHGLIGP